MLLLERQPFLEQLGTALKGAEDGKGSLVCLSGEAGVGKTSLVRTFTETLPASLGWAVGGCDSLTTPRPFAPLFDVAAVLELDRALLSKPSQLELFQSVLARLTDKSRVVIFEDVHWADEATLDLLRFLGRRMRSSQSLFMATYRDDEVGAYHPLRTVLGDLATAQAVTHLRLPRLSEEAVAQLAEDSDIDPKELYRQTSGNPFFVTEILGAKLEGIPRSVRDAVLARAARLSPSSRAVLSACAVMGARIEAWLLEDVVGAELEAVESCLDSGMLLSREDGYAFRHELTRQAILEATSALRRTVLHRLALETLEASASQDYARLAHHAEEAEDGEAVLRYAVKAAEQAAVLHSHRESVSQYERVLRFADELRTSDKVQLLESYARECRLTAQLDKATDALREAVVLRKDSGESLKEGENLALLAGALVRAGQNADGEQMSLASIERLETLPESAELARAYSVQASLRMLNRDAREAIGWAQKALLLAEKFNDLHTLVRANETIWAGYAIRDNNVLSGREYIERALHLAQEAGLDAQVNSIYQNLGSGAGEYYAFETAEHYLKLATDYGAARDLDTSYGLAWQALSDMYQGRWNEATEVAKSVLAGQASTISRIMALVALGRVRTRRGDPDNWAVLDDGLELALQTDTLQRLAPIRTARAEAAWLEGDTDRVKNEVHSILELAIQKKHIWFAGELAYWFWKTGGSVQLPFEVAEPFALQMQREWQEAAEVWKDLLCPYERARALAESGDEVALKEALTIFETLGASPMVYRIKEKLHSLGVRSIPRGPRASTLANPAGLTNKELQVLGLLVEGLSNAEVAAKLHRSEKTVGHHVSAILGKLEVRNRTEAAREAVRRGIITDKGV